MIPFGVVSPSLGNAGGGSWHPSDAPSTLAYYAPGDWTLLGTAVTGWTDSSGNGRDAAQPDAGIRWALTAADPRAGGLDAVGCDAEDGKLGIVLPTMGAAGFYCVSTYYDGTRTSFVTFSSLFGETGPDLGRRVEAIPGTDQVRGSRSNVDFAADVDVNAVTAGKVAGDDSIVLPLPLSVVRMYGRETTQTAYTIGYLEQRNNRNWVGAHRAFLLTDGTEDAATVERYTGVLAHGSGIAALLPAGHPYRGSPP